jgi:2-iminobutanoate/2-iminopropanoate deaminase
MSCCHEKKIVSTEKAPKAIGPYSVAVKSGAFVFSAGQVGLDPVTNNIVTGGIEAETRQALTNVSNILEAAGSDLQHVLKTTVFLKDINDFAKMNAIYGEFFKENPPARSALQVAALPKNAMVEIETVAVVKEDQCDCDCCKE